MERMAEEMKGIVNIKNIKNLRNQGDYVAALAACCELLQQDEGNFDVLRLRASIYALMKMYGEAFQDYQFLIDFGPGKISDFYLAADIAVSFKQYEQACEWLLRVVELGREIEDDAFESAAYFLLAYAQMQTHDFEKALQSLIAAQLKDPNISLPLPGEPGVASPQHLKDEIYKRKALRTA